MAKSKIQAYLPNTGPQKNEKVHKAAIDLLDLNKEEQAAKMARKNGEAKLMQIMEDEKLPKYFYGELRVIVKHATDKVVVKTIKEKVKKPRKAKKGAA